MASFKNIHRKMRAILADLDIEIIDIRIGKHVVYRVRNRHCVIGSFPVSISPSENQRGAKNNLKRLQRFAERTEQPTGRHK